MVEDSAYPAVQVLCAMADEQPIVEVEFVPGMTAAEAVDRSGLLARFAASLGPGFVLGVWGVQVDSTFALKPGDRVEISRPLQVDPREMRRDLLRSGRVMGGADLRKKD